MKGEALIRAKSTLARGNKRLQRWEAEEKYQDRVDYEETRISRAFIKINKDISLTQDFVYKK